MRLSISLALLLLGLAGTPSATAQSEQVDTSGSVVCAPDAQDACLLPSAPPGVATFLESMLNETQVANTTLDVLHQQALTASTNTSALTEPSWDQSTTYALAELRSSADALQGAPVPPAVVQPLAERLAVVGSDLDSAADAYEQGIATQDAALVTDSDNRLQEAAVSLQPLVRELAAVAATYQPDD